MAATPPPNQPTAPPPEPGPGASRDEWRAQRYGSGWYGPWNWWGGGSWGGGWFWGVALLVIGAYYLLLNLGLLGRLRGDVLWPVLLILFWVYLLIRRNRGRWP